MNEIFCGEALAVLETLPDNFVQCVVTSPPYYGLRSYLPDGHPDKLLEIGLEDTPQDYIARLVQVFREVRRVLRKDGICWLNIDDSRAGSRKGYGGIDHGKLGLQAHAFLPPAPTHPPIGFKHKDLMMIPARLAIALCDDGWYLRSAVIWQKPNCLPESVLDRPTDDYEHVFLLAKSTQYFYDHSAIREEGKEWKGQAGTFVRQNGKATHLTIPGQDRASHRADREDRVPPGRNKRAVWSINTAPYPESHFATFPPQLAETCILAGSRLGDVVLDPFMGAGTTAMVAIRHHRNWLGIELNPDYIKLAMKRIATVQTTLWEEGAD